MHSVLGEKSGVKLSQNSSIDGTIPDFNPGTGARLAGISATLSINFATEERPKNDGFEVASYLL